MLPALPPKADGCALNGARAEHHVLAKLMQWQHRRDRFCCLCGVRVAPVGRKPRYADSAGCERFLIVPVCQSKGGPQAHVTSRSASALAWCNGFNFATNFTGRPKLLVILARQRADSGTRDTGTARRDSTESSAAFWACSATTPSGPAGKKSPGASPESVKARAAHKAGCLIGGVSFFCSFYPTQGQKRVDRKLTAPA
jgi:hypothetical protein